MSNLSKNTENKRYKNNLNPPIFNNILSRSSNFDKQKMMKNLNKLNLNPNSKFLLNIINSHNSINNKKIPINKDINLTTSTNTNQSTPMKIFEKPNISVIINKLSNLFSKINEYYYKGISYLLEANNWLEIFYNNVNYLILKDNSLYMKVCKLMYLTIIILYDLSKFNKYNFFVDDVKNIINKHLIMSETIYNTALYPDEINIRQQSGVLQLSSKDLGNNLKRIFERYMFFNPAISNDINDIYKKLDVIDFNELHDFYLKKIKDLSLLYPTEDKEKNIKEEKKDSEQIKDDNKLNKSANNIFTNNHNLNENNEIRKEINSNNNNKDINKRPLSVDKYSIKTANNIIPYNKIDINNFNENKNNQNKHIIVNYFTNNRNIKKYNSNNNENVIQKFKSSNILFNHNKLDLNIIKNNNPSNFQRFQSSKINFYNPLNQNYQQNPNIQTFKQNISNENKHLYNSVSPISRYNHFSYNSSLSPSNENKLSTVGEINYNFIYNDNIFINKSNTNQFTKNKNCYLNFPSLKPYTLVLDLDETLVHVPKKTNKIFLRPGCRDFLHSLLPYYELILFTSSIKEYADQIINFIEIKEKYFTYCLYRENTILISDFFFKDINKLGRDIKRIIIIDDKVDNIELQYENGIAIKPYIIDRNNPQDNDYVLYDLQRILIKIAKENPDDIRQSLRIYKSEIINKITSG